MNKDKKINLLGIGLDYFMLLKDNVRGDVRKRQLDYAKELKSMHLIVYSPRSLKLKQQTWGDNYTIYPTNSLCKATFLFDVLRIAKKICRENKIEAITTEDPFITGLAGYLLKKKSGIPLNIQVHIDFYDNKYWIKDEKINYFFNILGKWLVRKADTLRVGTSRDKRKLKTLGVSEDKVSIIPVYSKPEKFGNVSGEEVRKRYLNNGFNKLIMFVGRFTGQKDIPTLLKALSVVITKYPGVLAIIIGSGAQEGRLKKMADNLGIAKNVIFPGAVNHDELPKYLSACDVFVIPSIFEGTCIALAEAAMSEKPVVSTNIAGVDDLVLEGKTGFIVEQKDYKRMAERLLYLFNNPKEAHDMGIEGRIHVEKQFSQERNIEGLINLWKRTAQAGLKNGK
ncbi:MAG: glycosyltransferase family 4 protein [Candidatus Omnitrophica bacterium]|nr:glycosyltransferase family 4 protein [Candidatus Omnitrophota bacterium]